MEQESISGSDLETEVETFVTENLSKEQLDAIAYKLGEIFTIIRSVPGGQELLEKSMQEAPAWLLE